MVTIIRKYTYPEWRILLIWGAIILFLVMTGLAVYLVEKDGDFPSFASLFSGITLRREAIEPNFEPRVVTTGDYTALTWTHTGRTRDGQYAITYDCGKNIELHTVNGSLIPCGAHYFIGTRNSIVLVPTLKDQSPADLQVSVSFVEDGDSTERLRGSTTLSVIPRSGGQPTTTPPTTPGSPTPSPTPTPSPVITPQPPSTVYYPPTGGTLPPIDPNGVPDLSLQILATGIVSTSSTSSVERFTAKSSIMQGDRPAIQFMVKNIGTNVSGGWNFKVELPTALSGNEFTSGTETSLRPGDFVIYTIGFDSLRNSGENRARIIVDPNAQVNRDSVRSNNEGTAILFRGF